jgi:GPH family glycoside/pentoside/hexuronide:cation symporter
MTPSGKKLPVRTKLLFNSGTFLDQVGLHAANTLAFPVYNVLLGVNPALIGYALALFRLWDAFADPVIGAITDRSASKWGRRKPFMVFGAILASLLFPVMYFPNPAWGEPFLLMFFVVIGLTYFTVHPLYAIPYQALGMELAPDYDDRTSLFAYRSVFMLIGFMGLAWIYPLAQSDFFSSPLNGVRWIAAGVGLFFLGTALIPVFTVRERFSRLPGAGVSHARESTLQAIKAVLSDRRFRRLTLVQVIIVFGSNVVSILGFYLGVFYLYGGDSKAAAPLMATGAAVATIVSIGSMFALPAVSLRLGKVQTVMACLCIQLVGSALKWVCFNPAWPWLSMLPGIFISLGNIGFWALAPALVADLCDLEELSSGRRREGGYASVTQWLNKVSFTVATALSGVILVWIGFAAANGGAQPPRTLFLLKLLYTVVPGASFACALWLLRQLDISRESVRLAQSTLEARRGAV